ncbi:MAG: NAD(P)H-hydrate dehydratase [Methylococcales bacterium]|nr:NAD(P)H-hydrate dehydratase [Methylococcales bacterium]
MDSLPHKLYKVAQVREFERRAIEDFGIASFELMRLAGVEVYKNIRLQWPNIKSITIFCGAGNNAGDGYIVASLALQANLRVTVYSLVNPDRLAGDAFTACQHYQNQHGVIVPFENQAIDDEIIVDALLGTGLNRSVNGVFEQAINKINLSLSPVISIDSPSGLNADTGAVMGCAVKADTTITFIALKQGLFTGQAAEYCGELIYSSLMLPDLVFKGVESSATRVYKKLWPSRNRCTHKGTYGHVLIIGGDVGYSGAVKLAGEAALRMGAGLVTIATNQIHADFLNINRPELMCHGVACAQDLAVLINKATVVVIGPGLGQSAWAQELFDTVLMSHKPLVIDADGLNLLAKASRSHTNWILTPHPGEAARLLSCKTLEIQQDRFSAISALQSKYDGVIVLKGAGTLIASDHECIVSSTGNPGMASGGMGDVLAGVIAGLLAQGESLLDAAQHGVYGHGYAADLAIQVDGERGLLASDLMPYIKQWINNF